MRCEICNKSTFINWGNAYATLCEEHAFTKEGSALMKKDLIKQNKRNENTDTSARALDGQEQFVNERKYSELHFGKKNGVQDR